MKTSIEHLPEEKQSEVHEIVEAVNNPCLNLNLLFFSSILNIRNLFKKLLEYAIVRFNSKDSFFLLL
jgi:hypothetical protein